MLRRRPARCEHEHYIARRGERVGVDALDGLQAVLRSERGVTLERRRGGGVGEVEAVCIAKGDEPCEGGVCDAAEADEADCPL